MKPTRYTARLVVIKLVLAVLAVNIYSLSVPPSHADQQKITFSLGTHGPSALGSTYFPIIRVASLPPPTLLASYVVRGGTDHRASWPGYSVWYRPRQFSIGLQADSGDRPATVDDVGSYSGWDILNTPNFSVNTFATRADWLTLKLNRSATLAIVWRGGNPIPNWLRGWQRGGDVVLSGKTVPAFVRPFSAGEVRLSGVYDPGSTSTVSRDTYLVLLAEADGTPSTAPPVPAGKEVPQPNQTCPGWVHDQYVTRGPDGKIYPTWHPQIDPIYWCYFHHEHGSDPALFAPAYRPAYGYTAAMAGEEEPHAGFKTYVLDDQEGHMWIFTHHFGTAGLKRACARFHTVDIAVADKTTRKILADLHFTGDFGKSVAASADASDVPLTPPACPDQAAIVASDGSSGVRKIQVASRDRSGYEPWRLAHQENILGLQVADLTFATAGAIVICNELTCDKPVTTGFEGEFRFLTFNPGFGLVAGTNTGVFYTDTMGNMPMSAGETGAVRQYVEPGLNITNPQFLDGHGYPAEPWQMMYVMAPTPPADQQMSIENALQSPN